DAPGCRGSAARMQGHGCVRGTAPVGARPRSCGRRRLDARAARTERLRQESHAAYPRGPAPAQGGGVADLRPAAARLAAACTRPGTRAAAAERGRPLSRQRPRNRTARPPPAHCTLARESPRDLAIASQALSAVGLSGYEERDVL